MGKITFILGGSRSGKSNYAQVLAKKYKRVAFIATCQPLDKEMRQRIKMHRELRPKHWQTFEEYRDIALTLRKISFGFDCIIIDCLTLFVSNLMSAKKNQKSIEEKIKRILLLLKTMKASAILISNEVGLGIVPENKLARDFRDIAGKVNQIVAKEAKRVIFMASGIPMKIKG
jgi:adenosylcobinamide kinase/adenosylcobinamide-phosphate guanylyltransferase